MKSLQKKAQKRNNKGFSLVELIIVIAIMAVLIAVLAPQFIKYVDRSRQSNDATMVSGIVTAVQTGVSDITTYDIETNVRYTITLDDSGLVAQKGTSPISAVAEGSGKGNIVNAIQDACGKSADLKPTANAWDSIVITFDISKDGNVKVTYDSEFGKYIGKEITGGETS